MAMHRTDRINEEYKHTVAQILRDIKDPRVPVMTSIIGVSVTPDLKFAKIAVSIMADEQQTKEAIKALNNAKGFVRKEVSNRMKIRYSPEITFVADSSIEYGAHIQSLLKKIESDGQDKK